MAKHVYCPECKSKGLSDWRPQDSNRLGDEN